MLFVLVTCTIHVSLWMLSLAENPKPAGLVATQELNSERSHQIAALNLFIFMVLVVLTVLTTWLFKHHRFRFVHETGLAIIYGLIVGVMIRYLGDTNERKSAMVYIHNTDNSSQQSPPELLRLNFSVDGLSTFYQYEYVGAVDKNNVDEKELEEKATFDPEIFFNVLLPPIIFNAGYSMKRKSFFKNFGAIMTFAFGGTIISSLAVAAVTYGISRLLPHLAMKFTDCFLFGAIISATDPVTVLAIFSDLNVDVDLYALVFGESVLNDAVAIVLASTIQHHSGSSQGFDGLGLLKALAEFLQVFLGAFLLGSAMGMLNALITKFTRLRDHALLETSLFFCMSYGTFLAAEAAGMTGIVAVLFCGICQAHYTYNNLSAESKRWTKELFEVLNFLMENFVFCYIGVSVFTYSDHYWNLWFILSAFLAIIVGRACNIYPLSFLLNLGRSNKIRYNVQHMMMFSGLRGAIAFALAIRNTESQQERLVFSTTLVIVITTVVLCGGFTTQMLEWLKIRVGVEEEPTELQRFEAARTRQQQQNYSAIEDASGAMAQVNDALGHTSTVPEVPTVRSPHSRLAEKAVLVRGWYKIDARFVKPLLTHAKPALTETLPTCCLPLAKLLTTEEQYTREDDAESDSDLIDDVELHYGDHNGGTASPQTVIAPGMQPNKHEATSAHDDAPLDLEVTCAYADDSACADDSALLLP